MNNHSRTSPPPSPLRDSGESGKKKAIVLISGGLDSATVLAMATHLDYECYALSFDYGQKIISELQAAKAIAKKFNVVEHKIFPLAIGELKGSALTDPSIEVPDYNNDKEIPITYVPARNTIFLTIALAWAEVVGANDIFSGICAVDYSGYPDCRPEYVEAFQKLANLATKSAVQGKSVTLHAPLLYLTKAETIKRGLQLGVDYSLTVSCYRATPNGQACGTCHSCTLRAKGFSEANVLDPTNYAVHQEQLCESLG